MIDSVNHRFSILFSVLFLIQLTSYGQAINQTAHYEREIKDSDPEIIIQSLKEKGLALIRDKDHFEDGKATWEVAVLDTLLSERWSITLPIEAKLKLVGYDYSDDLIYILFRTSELETSDLRLYTVHINTKEIRDYTIKQEISFRVTHFGVIQKVVVFGGYVNEQPAALLHDLETEKLKVIPGFFVKNTELLDLRVNTNNTFNVLTVDQKSKESKKLSIKTFDQTGELLVEDKIEFDSRRTILSGITSTLKNDELIIIGTWTLGSYKSASGIFTAVVDPFNDQELTYYDFGQLKHFLDYQNPKRTAKLREKSLAARNSSTPPEFKAYTSLIRLEESKDGFAALLEVYQPTTSTNSNYYWNDYSNPFFYGRGFTPYGYNPFMNRYYNPIYRSNSSTTTTSDSKVLHSSLMLLDMEGKLIDDYGLVLNEKKTGVLEQTSDFIYGEGKIAMAYKKEKEIYTLLATSPEEILLDTLAIKPQDPMDEIRSDTEDSMIRIWYNNNMYVWGYMRIKQNKPLAGAKEIFYINKVKFD